MTAIVVKLLGTVILIILLWIVQFHWKRRSFYKKAKQFTVFPKYLPVIGNSLQFTGTTEEVLKTVTTMPGLDTTVAVWLGSLFMVFVYTPEDMEVVLNYALAKSNLYDFMKPLVGNGLFSSPVNTWKPTRKILATTFNQKNLDSFVGIFVAKCEDLIKVLKKEKNNTNINIESILTDTTLSTVCATTMGYTNKTQDKDIGKAIHTLMEIAFKRIVNLHLQVEWFFKLTHMYLPFYKNINILHSVVLSIIAKRKNEIQEDNRYSDNQETRQKRRSFIELLLGMNKQNDQFSDENIRDEVSTLLVAGSDTSATILSFLCVTLGLHPEIQEKVFQEVMDVLGPTKTIDQTDLPKFKYMEMVLKETMRVFPVGPNILRKAEKDLTLPCGKIIPEGATIAVCILNLHRSEKYYPDPLKFDPERFSPKELAKRHPYAYLAFSGGPRNCIGLKYAMMSMKCIVASLIRNFYIHTHYKSIEEIRLQQNIVISPVEGYKVYVTERKRM